MNNEALPTIETLLSRLVSARVGERCQAARALAWRNDPRSIPPLIAALTDPWPQVRIEAAATLGDLRDQRAVAPLIAALEDEDTDVAWNAALALGKLKAPEAVTPLINALDRALQGSDLAFRSSVAEALGLLGDPAALPKLEQMASDRQTEFYGGGKVAEVALDAIRRINVQAGTP